MAMTGGAQAHLDTRKTRIDARRDRSTLAPRTVIALLGKIAKTRARVHWRKEVELTHMRRRSCRAQRATGGVHHRRVSCTAGLLGLMTLGLGGCVAAGAGANEDNIEDIGDAEAADGAWGEGGAGYGSVDIDASIVLLAEAPVSCPGISSFSIAPAEVPMGQPASLAIEIVGPLATIQWTVEPATGGQFSNSVAAITTFQCAIPGPMTVIANVGLPDSGACSGGQFTSFSGLINCESPGSGDAGP
jgi:hypothetical protein